MSVAYPSARPGGRRQEQAVPFRHLKGGTEREGFLGSLRTGMEHFRVDAPMDDLAGPPLRRPIGVDELLTAEGGDGHTGALLERGLFVARVGLGREEDGQSFGFAIAAARVVVVP